MKLYTRSNCSYLVPKEDQGREFEIAENEINQANYEEGLKRMVELIQICDFVAIDAAVETTGFLLKNEDFNTAYIKDIFNPAGKWYDEIKRRERTACLLEVGITIFKRNPNQPDEIEAEAFNIPVQPACLDDNEIARFRGCTWVRVQFDGYGQEFINDVEFDVNKSFYKGAPYLNRQLRERGKEYMKANPEFMTATRKRRLNRYLMPELHEKLNESQMTTIIERLKGVSKVFEAVSQHKVPIVGHHLLLKLILIYKDFIDFLPDTYLKCINSIKDLFQVIYDTKQIAVDVWHEFKISPVLLRTAQSCTLYSLLRNISMNGELQKFSVVLSKQSEKYVLDVSDIADGEIVEHETGSYCYVSGFDALTSGLTFLNMIERMEASKVDCGSKKDFSNYLNLFLKGDATRFKNRIYGEPVMPAINGHIAEQTKVEKGLSVLLTDN